MQPFFTFFDKVSVFMKKTTLWKSLCESHALEMFVNMSEYLEENDYAFEEIKPHVLTHLTNLERNFKNRFLELTLQQHEWMQNPFAVTIGKKINHLSVKAEESQMKLSCDTYLKIKFEALSPREFWIYIKKEHLELSKLATEVVLLFGTTYLWEKTFSAIAAIKSKYRNRLQLESDLRVAVSTIQPKMSPSFKHVGALSKYC
jgi:hypothetical protein